MQQHLPIVFILLMAATALGDVQDRAGFFSPQAVQQANSTIRQIQQQYGKDVIVETYEQIPAELRDQYDPQQKSTFFNNWMRARAQQLGANGVFILICRDPSYLEAGVGQQTQTRAFTLQDRNQLSSLMLQQFKQRNFDQGLLSGVQFIQQRMASNLARSGSNSGAPVYGYQAPRQTPGEKKGFALGFGSCFWWVLIIGAVIMFAMWMRRRSASPGYGGYGGPVGRGYGGMGPGGYGGYPPSSGGGFGRGMLGGLLGGAAGGWLYDKFRGRQAPPSSYDQGYSAPPPPPPSDQGQGFSGTGGSFDGGGGGGGGDFGGGGDSGNQSGGSF